MEGANAGNDLARQVRREKLQKERHPIHHGVATFEAGNHFSLLYCGANLFGKIATALVKFFGLGSLGRVLQSLGVYPVVPPEIVRPLPDLLSLGESAPVPLERPLLSEQDIGAGDHLLRP